MTIKKDALLGAILGALLAGVSIAGNVWRGDRHLVSVFPHLLALVIVPVFLYIVLRRMHRAGMARHTLQQSDRAITEISAALFAALLTAFAAVWYADPRSILLAGGIFVMTFLMTLAVGYLSVEALARLLTRPA